MTSQAPGPSSEVAFRIIIGKSCTERRQATTRISALKVLPDVPDLRGRWAGRRNRGFARRPSSADIFRRSSHPQFDHGHWWLAFHEETAVVFAGIIPSTQVADAGYFCRVGVLRKHCGQRLQLRLMRALRTRARRNGWNAIVSDTTDNIFSANNFIRAGYQLFQPQSPWAWPNTLYWRKAIA